MNDTELIEKEMDGVWELFEAEIKLFKEQFRGEPYGLNALTDEEHAAWFESWVGKWPPKVYKHKKTGELLVISAWVYALNRKQTLNGAEEIARYEKTKGIGNGASRMPQEQEVM